MFIQFDLKFYIYEVTIKPGTGLPHTQGIQGISGNFQVEENLREIQGNSGNFDLFFKFRETQGSLDYFQKIQENFKILKISGIFF